MKYNLPFEKAKNIAWNYTKKYRIKSRKHWFDFCKKGLKPDNIPSAPNIVYKNRGWMGWSVWLNNGIVNGRKYKINEDFFTVWSHDMAYVLGLWFADGCIYRSRWGDVFSICLHVKDVELLQNILITMESEHKLYKYNNCVKIQIGSNKIVKDLMSLGGKFRKSLDIGFPYVPKEYMPDFIRGYFDGDGSFYYKHNKKNKRIYASFVSGSKSFLFLSHEHLIANGIFNTFHKEKSDKCKNTYYRIFINYRELTRFGDYIYSNSHLFMNRKYLLYDVAKGINNE